MLNTSKKSVHKIFIQSLDMTKMAERKISNPGRSKLGELPHRLHYPSRHGCKSINPKQKTKPSVHNEWRKKTSVSCFKANTMFTVFSDIKSIMPHKYFPVGQTVNHYSYKDVLEGLREKRTVAKERSYGSTNGICHSALRVKQFFTPQKSPALFAKSRLL
jgi:hypothetical protein